MTEKAEEIPLSVSAVTVAVATYTAKDVSGHNTPTDLWVIVDKEIFNVSEFQDEHPGGKKIMQTVAGKDASKQFHKFHRDAILNRFRERLKVGTLKGDLEETERSVFGFGFLKKKKA